MSTSWRTVPQRSAPPRPERPVLVAVGAALIAALGPALWLQSVGSLWPVAVASTLAATAATSSGRTATWWGRALGAVAVGIAVGIAGTLPIGLWASVAWLASEVGIRRRPLLERVPAPAPEARLATVVLLALAAWRGSGGHGLGVALLMGATVLVLVLSSTRPSSFAHLGHRIGNAAAGLVSTVLFTALGLLTLLVPWAVQRTFHLDPLAPAGAIRGWSPRARRRRQPESPWSIDRTLRTRPTWARARSPIAGLVTAALIAGAVVGITRLGTQALPEVDLVPSDRSEVPPAFAGSGWYADHLEDLAWLTDEGGAWRPLRPRRLVDVRTRTIETVDGYRVSWEPPACDECPEVDLWLYGGSSTFGVGQRDEHTIASNLARLAWEDGIVLRVSNRGVIGNGHWWAARRFSWDASLEEAPDLVAFYEGYEEAQLIDLLDDPELVADEQAIDRVFEDYWREVQGQSPSEARRPPGASFDPPAPLGELSPAEQGELAAERYARVVQMSRDVGVGRSIPVRWFWQPTRWTHPDAAPPEADDGIDQDRQERYLVATANLPPDVVDLSDALDRADPDVFADEVVLNEEGAALVAAAMYRTLRTDLERAAGGER